MTNGANLFLFISRQFGNYDALLDRADTNNDGVLTKDEMGDLLRENYCPLYGDYTASQFNAFWTQLDTFQSGDIKRGVRDLNALNATEAANLEQKMVAYGKIYDALDSAVPAVFNKVSHYASQVNMTQDDLKELAAGYMVESGAIELANGNNIDGLKALAKQCACAAACNLIKDGFLKDDGVLGSVIKDSITDDYSLSGDKQLGTLIENYIQNQGANCTDINKIYEIVQTIKRIIQAYIQTAGLNPEWAQYTEGLDSQYKYNQSNGLNGLQISVIGKMIADTIKCSDYKSSLNVNYSGFEGLFNQVLKAWQNSLTGDFNTIKSSITKANFETSDGYKALEAFANILNDIGDNCNNGGGNHMSSILTFFAGLSGGNANGDVTVGSNLAKIMNSNAFKEIVADVLRAYLENPESISTPDSEDNLQVGFENEILKRVKENLDTLLAAAGITSDKDVEDILYYNIKGTEALMDKENDHYGNPNQWNLWNDAVQPYLLWVVQLAARDSAVNKALTELSVDGVNTSGFPASIPSGLEGSSDETILLFVEAVHNAINGVVGTGGTDGTGGTNGNDGPQVDPPSGNMDIHGSNVTPPDTNGRIRGEAFALKNIEKAKTAAKEQLHDYVALIKTQLTAQGFDETLLNRAVTSVNNYYDAAIDALFDQSGNGSINKNFNSHAFSYQYYDANGNLVESQNNIIQYTHHASDCVNTWNAIMNGSIESGSGLYWLESISLVNMHAIAFDKSKVWGKFCEFYDTVSGNNGAQGTSGTGNNNDTVTWSNANNRSVETGYKGSLSGVTCKKGSTPAKSYSYSSSNCGVVNVANNGSYEAVGAGNATITIKAYDNDNNVIDTKEIKIYVNDPYDDGPVGS